MSKEQSDRQSNASTNSVQQSAEALLHCGASRILLIGLECVVLILLFPFSMGEAGSHYLQSVGGGFVDATELLVLQSLSGLLFFLLLVVVTKRLLKFYNFYREIVVGAELAKERLQNLTSENELQKKIKTKLTDDVAQSLETIELLNRQVEEIQSKYDSSASKLTASEDRVQTLLNHERDITANLEELRKQVDEQPVGITVQELGTLRHNSKGHLRLLKQIGARLTDSWDQIVPREVERQGLALVRHIHDLEDIWVACSDMVGSAEEIQLQFERVNAFEIVRAIAQQLGTLNNQPLFTYELVNGLEGDYCFIQDRSRFTQIMHNLFLNVVEHVKRPDKKIRAQFRWVNENGTRHLELTFCDNGPGLDKGARECLQFGRRRAPNGRKIGLPGCRLYAQKMGGSISVSNASPDDEMSGAHIILKLPDHNDQIDDGAWKDFVLLPSPEKAILLVEDCERDAFEMNSWLRDVGFSVEHKLTLEDARKALSKAEPRYDLIVMDRHVGEENGYLLFKEFTNYNAKWLAISGDTTSQNELSAFHTIIPFLNKPLAPATFVRKVADLLEFRVLSCGNWRQRQKYLELALEERWFEAEKLAAKNEDAEAVSWLAKRSQLELEAIGAHFKN